MGRADGGIPGGWVGSTLESASAVASVAALIATVVMFVATVALLLYGTARGRL